MRIPTSGSHKALRQVVRKRTSLYDITRPDQGATGRFGENEASTTTIRNVELWLFEPTEINIDTEYGDRLGGDLQGLSMPAANVQVHDRVSHGSDTYEVERIQHLPNNDDKAIKMFALSRRTND